MLSMQGKRALGVIQCVLRCSHHGNVLHKTEKIQHYARTLVQPLMYRQISLVSILDEKNDQDLVGQTGKPNMKDMAQTVLGADDLPMLGYSDLAQMCEVSKSPEDLLALVEGAGIDLDIHDAVVILKKLSELLLLDNSSVRSVEEDGRFSRLQSVISIQAHALSMPALIAALKSMLSIIPYDNDLIRLLEDNVMKALPRVSVNQACNVLELHEVHAETALRRQSYSVALASVERRWIELNSPKDIVFLMYTRSVSTKLMSRLQERALDSAHLFSVKQLFRILSVLSQHQSRNKPLLRALVYHLHKAEWMLSASQLASLLYSLSTLRVHDPSILERATAEIIEHLQTGEIEMRVAVSLLNSLGILKWRDSELIAALTSAVLSGNIQYMKPELLCVIRTCAVLSLLPSSVEPALPEIVYHLQPALSGEPRAWLDVVWSLACLNKATPDVLKSILTEDFINELSGIVDLTSPVVSGKLASVAYEAQNLGVDVQLPSNMPAIRGIQGSVSGKFKLDVMTALLTPLPSGPGMEYVTTNVPLQGGCVVDLALRINRQGIPICLSSGPVEGEQQVCVKLLEFNDVTRGEATPSGHQTMVMRHIAAQKYKVVQIAYTDFMPMKSTDQTILLQKLLKNAGAKT